MDQKYSFKAMPEILSGESRIAGLIEQARALVELNRRFQLALPDTLRHLCRLANVRRDTVVLVCESQIEASKLRMFSREILQIIRDDFKIPAKKLRIKVAQRRLMPFP